MSECILVVEDEAVIAADIRDVLLGFGYDVPAPASTTEEALSAVAQFRPDLVLMDVRLKGGDDGVTTAAGIRDRWGTPIVFLTSHADDATLSRAESVDPFGYLLKPFNDYELRATIQMVLRRSVREAALTLQSAVLAAAVNGAEDAILAVNGHGEVLFANDAAQRAEGMVNATKGSTWTTGSCEICLPDTHTPCPAACLPLVRALQGETVHDVELFIQPRSGAEGCLYTVNATPLLGPAGSVVGAIAIARDVTAPRSNLSDLHRLTSTDDLTGACNRRGFMEVASARLRSAAAAGRTPAVCFIDLNGLKQINDTMGHAAGDRALVDTYQLLRATFRASDIVARLGGDEFVVLITEADAISWDVRERLESAVERFNDSAEREYRLSMSVGVAEYDAATDSSLPSLLAQADKRMYEAKALRAKRCPESRR